MIETILYFALGFLSASLVALVIIPSVWRRAVRLTRRNIELTTPLTRAEIRADRDQLSAEFAVSLRKLEIGLSTSRRKVADTMVALSRSQDEVRKVAREREVAWAEVQRLTEAVEEYKAITGGEDPRAARISDLEADNARLRIERNLARDELKELESATGFISRERATLADEQSRYNGRIAALTEMLKARESEIALATQQVAEVRTAHDQMATRLEAGAREIAMARQERDYLREQFASLQAAGAGTAATGSGGADNLLKTIDALSVERDELRDQLSQALADQEALRAAVASGEALAGTRAGAASIPDFDDLRRTLIDLGARVAERAGQPSATPGLPHDGELPVEERAAGEAAAEAPTTGPVRRRRSPARKARETGEAAAEEMVASSTNG